MASTKRPNLITLIATVFIVIIIFRLFYIQIINGDEYRRISNNNFLKEVLMPAPRGAILDRFGREVAVSRAVVNLYYKNNLNDNNDELKKFLYKEMEINKDVIRKIINNAKTPKNINKRFLLVENLTLEKIYKVENRLNSFQSLELIVDYLRHYPFNEVGSHKIGYLKSNDKRDKIYGSFLSSRLGASGIEKFFDDSLRGSSGTKYLLVDNRGRETFSNIISYDKNSNLVKAGDTLNMTIDIEMEKLIYSSFGNFNGAAMVHDINTGEILALISKPSFNPNIFSKTISSKKWKRVKGQPDKPFLDRSTLSSNPPGSIIKIVTAVAALEEEVIDDKTEHYCKGYYSLGGRKFRCWKQGGHGKVDVVKALITSCDVFFYKVGLSLGIERYSKWLKNFGFGEKVALLFPQNSGVVPSKKFISKYLKGKWYKGDMVNVAIGQGYLTVNPIQASVMTSIIASNGDYPELKIIKDNKESNKKKLDIDNKTFLLIQKGLLGVVNSRDGTGFHAYDDGQLAGKTGTAQVISKGSKDYNIGKFKNHGWYTSYYPYNKPQIVITIFVENGFSGGRSGGPIIKKIVQYYKKNYLNIDGIEN